MNERKEGQRQEKQRAGYLFMLMDKMRDEMLNQKALKKRGGNRKDYKGSKEADTKCLSLKIQSGKESMQEAV